MEKLDIVTKPLEIVRNVGSFILDRMSVGGWANLDRQPLDLSTMDVFKGDYDEV